MNEQKLTKKFTIAQLGHLGVGGIWGMTPRGKEQINQQNWLREVWDESKKQFGIPRRYPIVLVIGGEATEGHNQKNEQEDIWLPRLDDQVKLSAILCSEWIGQETEEVLILYSHTYHGSSEVRVEEMLATELQSRFPHKKILAGTEFKRSYFGKTLRFRHGDSGGYVYLSTANERDIKVNLIEYGLDKKTRVDENYAFHNHRLASATFEKYRSTWIPCFKLLDTTGQMRKPDAWNSDIGMMITTFEKRFGEVRVNNDALIFHPTFEFEDLEQSKNQFKIWVNGENHKDKIRLKELLSKKEEKTKEVQVPKEKDRELLSVLAREEGDK